MRAGFKRSRTRARVYSLYFRSLCGSIIDQSKSCRNFSSEKGEERRASFSKNLFFFPIDDRFGRKRKKMARDESCLAQGWIVLSHLPSPSLPPSLENRSAFSFTPLASRQRHWRESVPSPSSRSSLSLLLLLLLRRGSRPSPPPRRRAFSHPAIGLPSGVRRERAGTYDAIGYRISAGSLIGRSTAHGRSRSPPSYD